MVARGCGLQRGLVRTHAADTATHQRRHRSAHRGGGSLQDRTHVPTKPEAKHLHGMSCRCAHSSDPHRCSRHRTLIGTTGRRTSPRSVTMRGARSTATDQHGRAPHRMSAVRRVPWRSCQVRQRIGAHERQRLGVCSAGSGRLAGRCPRRRCPRAHPQPGRRHRGTTARSTMPQPTPGALTRQRRRRHGPHRRSSRGAGSRCRQDGDTGLYGGCGQPSVHAGPGDVPVLSWAVRTVARLGQRGRDHR
jgi:hypothetical protein